MTNNPTFLLLCLDDIHLVFLDEESYDQIVLQAADLVWGQANEVVQSGARYTLQSRDDLKWEITFLERPFSFEVSPVVRCPLHFDLP